MARDGLSAAFRVNWTCSGPKSRIVTNTFYAKWFNAGVPGMSDYSAACNDVWTFFHGTAGGSTTIEYYLGPQIYRASNSVLIDAYSLDLTNTGHYFGSPVFTVQKTPTNAGSSTCLPNEMAAVLSYRAAYGSDPEHDGITRPRASDRGRIYLGPLGINASTDVAQPDATKVAQVTPAFITIAMAAISTLFTSLTSHGWNLSVWSRKEQLLKTVLSKAMDTSFDSQRRREQEPAPLQTWVVL